MKYYSPDHMYVKESENGICYIGLSTYAAAAIGKIEFLQIPSHGTKLNAGEVAGTFESSKIIGEYIAPISGVVHQINPKWANGKNTDFCDAEGEDWLFAVETSELDLTTLLDEETYRDEFC